MIANPTLYHTASTATINVAILLFVVLFLFVLERMCTCCLPKYCGTDPCYMILALLFSPPKAQMYGTERDLS